MTNSDDNIYRPYSPVSRLGGCTCGQHASVAEHDAAALAATEARATDVETLSRDFIEAAAVKALFPLEATRRAFLSAVGQRTAMAAIASVLPLSSLQAMAQDKGSLEKTDLKIGFIPITCATPLIMAHPLGFYQQQGLNVELSKTAGWALVRDKMLNNEYDASHFLSPMPLSISLGLGSSAKPMQVATIQNVNGQAITLALKHKNNRDPKHWKGFKFAIPFEFSMHNFLLRYYLAEAGLNPDTDVQLRVVPPAEMVANLRAGNIDGFLGPDPFNQRAVYEEVGFIHLLTKEIWDGHPRSNPAHHSAGCRPSRAYTCTNKRASPSACCSRSAWACRSRSMRSSSAARCSSARMRAKAGACSWAMRVVVALRTLSATSRARVACGATFWYSARACSITWARSSR